jgi:hypothetical protein
MYTDSLLPATECTLHSSSSHFETEAEIAEKQARP